MYNSLYPSNVVWTHVAFEEGDLSFKYRAVYCFLFHSRNELRGKTNKSLFDFLWNSKRFFNLFYSHLILIAQGFFPEPLFRATLKANGGIYDIAEVLN